MRRLVLVRHGESFWNVEGRVQGQRCSGLSPRGLDQAARTATELAAAHAEVRLVSSDLPRARQTAAELARALGTPVESDQQLRERRFGRWEGLLRTEVAQQDPARWERWLAGEDVIAEVGGESREQLAARAAAAFAGLLATTPQGATTIVFTHGGTIWHGAHRLLGLAAGLGGLANASITEVVGLEHGGDGAPAGRTVLDRWNQVAHLPVELRTPWYPPRRLPDDRDLTRTG